MFKLFSFPIKKILKMPDIFRHTVRHRMLEAVPYKFIRVELGGITGERIGEDASAGFKKFFNRSGFMNGARIPKKNESFLKMPEKISKKSQDFGITDVLRLVEADVETGLSSLGRNADSGDGRNLCPSPMDLKNRGSAAWRPGSSDRGNKTKPALVEENQRDSKRFRLFLYAAKYGVSTVLSSPHPVLWPLFLAFGSSSPAESKTTRDGSDDTTPRSVFGSLRRFCGLSKDPWNSLPSEALPKESLSMTVSDAVSSSPGGPGPVLTSSLQNLSLDTPSAIDGQNLPKNRFFRQQPVDLILDSTTRQRAGASVRDAFGFHMVSWNHNSIFRNVFPLLLRYSIAGSGLTLLG